MNPITTATIIFHNIAMFTEDAKFMRRLPKGTKVKILEEPVYITLFGDKVYSLVDDGTDKGYILSEALSKDGEQNGKIKKHS